MECRQVIEATERQFQDEDHDLEVRQSELDAPDEFPAMWQSLRA